jgi:GMP synthase (glutamine-hydrolysing)
MAKVIVIANRGQYNHRIYRTLRYLGVDSSLVKNTVTPEDIEDAEVEGIVIGGGQYLDASGNSGRIIKRFAGKVPVLGICLGHQLMAKLYGGGVRTAPVGEYAEAEIMVDEENDILKGLGPTFKAWVSHKDEVSRMPKDFVRLAHSKTCSVEAMAHKRLPLYGVQFHPEVEHTPKGPDLFKNFLRICGI